MAQITVRVRWQGRVQGVWFRAFVRDAAESHQINGWVANVADGSVVAELEGEQSNIGAVLSETLTGPPAARVSHIGIDVMAPQGFRGFEVRRDQ